MRNVPWALALTIVLLRPPAFADDAKLKRDAAVEPTNWGRVVGQIYDAKSGAPLEGAMVVIQQDGTFAADGKTICKTDAMGRYQCEAIIGRVSENFDVGRALVSSPVLLLFGAATNRTKRIDVSRLNVRVTLDGYSPFEGTVLCRSSRPEKFTVSMQPILLTRAGGAEISTTAEGWGIARIADIVIDPAVLHPKTKATVSVKVKCPAVFKTGDVKVICVYRMPGKMERKELKAAKTSEEGVITFIGDFTVPKSAAKYANELTATLVACPYDIAEDGRSKSTLLQIAETESEEKLSAKRSEAYKQRQLGNNASAAASYKEICSSPDATIWDYSQLGEISDILHDNGTCVEAYKRAVELTPAKPEEMRLEEESRYASALVGNHEGDKVIAEYAPLVDGVKERDRPIKIPVPLMVALGNAYIQQDRLADAEAINQQLLKWPTAGLYRSAGQFRNDLRMAQAQSKLKADPNNADLHANYGHVLMDMGRWEEAVSELQTAAKIDPNLPAIRRDEAYAMLHINGGESRIQPELDEALSAAESATRIADKKGKPSPTKDFFAWHKYGILLYTKARKQQAANDPAVNATLDKCRDALRNALKCGRSGADVDYGYYAGALGFVNGSTVAIAGFAYPEADSDFVLLDSLRALAKDSNDYLAHFNLGMALIDLGQPQLADSPIHRALDIKRDFVEAGYAAALIAMHDGDSEAAIAGLKEVLRLNPRHSHANLILARLYTENGDAASAAACLAAHAAIYGDAQ